MMAAADAIGQWAIDPWAPPGVHVLTGEDDPAGTWTFAWRRMQFAIAQRLGQRYVRRLRTAYDAKPNDPVLLARSRAFYDRLDTPPHIALMEANATRTTAPLRSGPGSPVPADWFAPSDKESDGVVFYVHGGSFVAHRSPRITALVGRFAAAAGARVYAPNYRLAPEYPCPAAVDDIAAAWRWHSKTWPDTPVVALAESAGAAVLLAALQRVRDAGEPLPCGIVLLSPWVDLALQSWSVVAASLAHSTPYTMETLALMTQFYLRGGVSATDPVASPIYGRFHDFPPILIHACKDDILYDDALRLADRIRDVNGDLTVRFWTGETHVWERMDSVKARQSTAFAAKFIRQRLDEAGR